MLNKIDFRTNTKKDKAGHYIMIKGSICQEGITTVNIYAPSIGAHNIFKKQILTDLKDK